MTTNNVHIFREVENKILELNGYMISNIDNRNYLMALKIAYEMFCLLNISNFTAECYNDLYYIILEKIFVLIKALDDTSIQPGQLSDLYEEVQSFYFCIPRCYAMIIVGSTIITRDLNLFTELSEDMTYACSAAQHPLKGLYLYKFLVDRLLSTGASKIEGFQQSVANTLIINFRNMNILWVRLTHAIYRDDANLSNLHDRLKLFLLFSFNKLSELADANEQMFDTLIFPSLLKEIVLCSHKHSQRILYEFLLTSFNFKLIFSMADKIFDQLNEMPDNFKFYDFIDRFRNHLEKYIIDNTIQDSDVTDMVRLAHDKTCALIDAKTNIPRTNAFKMYLSIFGLVVKYAPFAEMLDNLMCRCMKLVDGCEESSDLSSYVRELLIVCMSQCKDFDTFIRLKNYTHLFQILDVRDRASVILVLIDKLSNDSVRLTSFKQVKKLSGIVDIILDTFDSFKNNETSTNALDPIQIKSCEAVNLVCLSPDPRDIKTLDRFYDWFDDLITKANSKLQMRVIFTFVDSVLMNTKRLFKNDETNIAVVTRLLTKCHKLIARCNKSEPDKIIQLNINCALYIDSLCCAELNNLTNVYLRESLTVFEERATSPIQLRYLMIIVNCLVRLKTIDSESFMDFCTKIEKTALTFTSYTNQCRGLLHAAHLYWHSGSSSGELVSNCSQSVLRCLKKAETIISNCIGEELKITLFCDLAMKYLYFAQVHCDQIDAYMIQQIYENIEKEAANVTPGQDCSTALKYYSRVKEYHSKVESSIPQHST